MKNKISNGVETKNLLLWVVIILIIGMGVMMFIVPNNHNPSPNPTNSVRSVTYSASSLTALETNFDFGTILMGDGIVSHQFEIRNDGSEPVKIGKVYTSCACTTAYIIEGSGKKIGKFGMPGHGGMRATADMEVVPGESVIMEAVFDPAFHGPAGVGLAERTIYVETNSTESPMLELSFRATVTR